MSAKRKANAKSESLPGEIWTDIRPLAKAAAVDFFRTVIFWLGLTLIHILLLLFLKLGWSPYFIHLSDTLEEYLALASVIMFFLESGATLIWGYIKRVKEVLDAHK